MLVHNEGIKFSFVYLETFIENFYGKIYFLQNESYLIKKKNKCICSDFIENKIFNALFGPVNWKLHRNRALHDFDTCKEHEVVTSTWKNIKQIC